MHAIILIGADVITLANDETFVRPVSITNTKFLAARITQFVKPTNIYFDKYRTVHGTDSDRLWRTTIIARIMDGMPVAAA